MKRKLILLVVTIVFLVGFGAILHSPPSMIDAVTGATPKSKKAAQASAQLEGSYVLGINMMSDGLDNENTRNKLKELALDDSETNETNLMKTDISFRQYCGWNCVFCLTDWMEIFFQDRRRSMVYVRHKICKIRSCLSLDGFMYEDYT